MGQWWRIVDLTLMDSFYGLEKLGESIGDGFNKIVDLLLALPFLAQAALDTLSLRTSARNVEKLSKIATELRQREPERFHRLLHCRPVRVSAGRWAGRRSELVRPMESIASFYAERTLYCPIARERNVAV